MKTLRAILVPVALTLTSLNAFAANDFWLDYNFSTSVSFDVIKSNEVILQPPKFLPLTSYPVVMLQAGVSGAVIVQFSILEDGTVKDISVLEAHHKEFSDAARKAVEGFLFTPVKKVSAENHIVAQMKCSFIFKVEPKSLHSPPSKASSTPSAASE